MSGAGKRPATKRAPKQRDPARAPARPRRHAVVVPPAHPGPGAPFEPVRLPPFPGRREAVEATLPRSARFGIPILLFAGTLLLFTTNLDDPPGIVFDEAHYIHWSREIARGQLLLNDSRVPESPVNYEHPPLAKHIMAASYQVFGAGQLDLSWPSYEKGCAEASCPEGRTWAGCNQPRPECRREALAWRMPSALIGASTVPALYLLALRLFNSVPGGLFAAALLVLDNLWYLHSRLAMLDVFAAGLAVWAFALLLGRGRSAPYLGSVAFGLAVASKYTAVFLLPVFLLAHYFRTSPGAPWRRTTRAVLLGLGIPIAIFVASYGPYLALWMDEGVGKAAQRFVYVQIAALSWDYGGIFEHTSASGPWAWIPHINPTFYYWPGYEEFTETNQLEPPFMYAVGNVALWWPATLGLLITPIAIAVWWIRRRAPLVLHWDVLRAFPRLPFALSPARSLVAAAVMFWAGYGAWFMLQRTTFNYYATFNVPFFALFAAGLLHFAWRWGTKGRVLATAYVAVVGAWFTAWWPIVSGAPVTNDHFEAVWGFVPWMSR